MEKVTEKYKVYTGMAVYTYNVSNWGAEAGGF